MDIVNHAERTRVQRYKRPVQGAGAAAGGLPAFPSGGYSRGECRQGQAVLAISCKPLAISRPASQASRQRWATQMAKREGNTEQRVTLLRQQPWRRAATETGRTVLHSRRTEQPSPAQNRWQAWVACSHPCSRVPIAQLRQSRSLRPVPRWSQPARRSPRPCLRS